MNMTQEQKDSPNVRWLVMPDGSSANDYVFRNCKEAEPLEEVKTANGKREMWLLKGRESLKQLMREAIRLKLPLLPFCQINPDEPAMPIPLEEFEIGEKNTAGAGAEVVAPNKKKTPKPSSRKMKRVKRIRKGSVSVNISVNVNSAAPV